MWLSSIALFFLFAPMDVEARGEIHLRSPVFIKGRSIFLHQIAEIKLNDGVKAKLLSEMPIGQLPAGKKSLRIPSSYILSRIQEIVGNNSIEFKAPKVIHVRQKKVMSLRENIKKLLVRFVHKNGDLPKRVLLSVKDIKIPTSAVVALKKNRIGGSSLSVVEPQHHHSWNGRIFFRISIQSPMILKGKNYSAGRTFLVSADIKWFEQQWVSKRNIRFLEKLQPRYFYKKLGETRRVYRAVVVLAKNRKELKKHLVGMRSNRNISRGQVLRVSFLDAIPDVLPGESVKVILSGAGGLTISTAGKAMGKGTIGRTLQVRIKKTRKIISGRLNEEKVLEARL